jgi:TPR repeat protein
MLAVATAGMVVVRPRGGGRRGYREAPYAGIVRDMTKRRTLVSLASIASFAIAACGPGNLASRLATPPAYEPHDQAKCSIRASQAKPLIVEWPSADRSELEALVHQGVVAVRYQGCEMELLPRCLAHGKYAWTGTTGKDDHLAIRDADTLYANLPLGAAGLEGKLQKDGELDVDTTIVGRWEAEPSTVREDELTGDCARATHVVTAVTAGAFRFTTKASASVGADASVLGFGAGGSSSSDKDVLAADGTQASCDTASSRDTAPPEGCGAMIRLEVAPIAEGMPCPPSTSWNGQDCASEAKCPRGTFLVDGSCARNGRTYDLSVACAGGNIATCAAECERRGMESCAELGFRYATGDGVPKDDAKSASLTRKACDGGSVRGCMNLATDLFADTHGSPKDEARAAKLRKGACEKGGALACEQLAEQYWDGIGVTKDRAHAIALFDKACGADDSTACFSLAQIVTLGKVTTKDLPRGFTLYRHACDLGLPAACTTSGAMLEAGEGAEKDEASSFRWVRRACDMRSAEGCASLAWHLINGRGAPVDEPGALVGARQACNARSAMGCRIVAAFYDSGHGVAQDATRARALFTRACELGDTNACDRARAAPAP